MQKLIEKIEESKFFNKYGYKGHWISGSSTIVYPITHWIPSREIEIQIDPLVSHNGMTNSFKAMFNKLKDEFGLKEWFFVKNDGSCPEEYRIYY